MGEEFGNWEFSIRVDDFGEKGVWMRLRLDWLDRWSSGMNRRGGDYVCVNAECV